MSIKSANICQTLPHRWRVPAFGTLGLLAMASTPAFAAGTPAGTDITNQVTVGYSVGSVQQTAATASATVKVDRKVNLTVTRTDTASVIVAPLQQRAVTTFRLDNLSNDTLDFSLSATQLGNGATSAFGPGTDNFDASIVGVYLDNGNGTYDDGTDVQVTYLDEVAADANRVLFVVANIPDSRATGDIATVRLTATAAVGGAANTQGAVLTQTTGANTAGVDTVFADGAGSGDTANDGQFGVINDYRVSTAALTVNKTSTVVSDPVNTTTNPKIIPGAIVQFCVAVSNAAGGSTASGLTVSAQVSSDMTYVANSIRLNGTVVSGVCQNDGTAGGTFNAGVVSGTLSDLSAGSTLTLVYQAEVK
jgi:hypothetical protein